MLATVVTIKNPFYPLHDRSVEGVSAGLAIREILPKTELPFICYVNGNIILKAEYDLVINEHDVVGFVTVLQGGGGGGSNPLRILLTVAIAVVAPYAAVGILGQAAGTVGALTTIGSIATGVIGLVGNALINVALGASNTPSSIKQQNSISASPTYNLSAQGNRARIGEVIPDCYGRHLHYPDFCAEPYTEYSGNEQYLFQQFCLGQGSYEIEQIRISDTPIENFDEIEFEVVEPYQRGSLFPSYVETASEVSGQEAFQNVVIGPFPACSSGQVITAIAVDIVCPKGLFYANDDGGLDKISVSWKVEGRQIDDDGVAVGAGTWAVLGSHVITKGTATPIRESNRYEVAEGRYEVQFTRINAKRTDSRYGHDLIWSSLRGYSRAPRDYGGVTILNIRARATNNLSAQSSRQLNVIKTRKLPIWNGSLWSSPVATRSPAWAIANVLRAEYNGRILDSRVDLDGLLSLASVWEARNDYFDGIFDSAQVLYEMVNTVARAGRSKVYQQGAIWYTWRDQEQTLPVAMFNMRKIKRGSLKTQFLLPDENTADSVEITYLDEETWTSKTVLCALPDSAKETPVKVSLFGVQNIDQAWREGMHMAAQNRYRRNPVTFNTEMEGFIPSYGDMITLASDRAKWGQSGDLVEYDSGTLIIKTTEPLVWEPSGTHYFRFSKPNGGFDGPYEAVPGVDEFHAVIDAALSFTPILDTSAEKTSYSFGVGQPFGRTALVVGIRSRGLYDVEIQTINEDSAVHLADTGVAPPVSSSWNLPARITKPKITDLSVTLGGTSGAPLLQASWPAAAGAYSYLVEVSYDDGNSYSRVSEPSTSQASFPVRRGNIRVRVSAMGFARGDWIEYIGNPFLVPPPDVATLLVSTQTDGTRQFDWTLPGAKPPDLSGFIIKYRLGADSGWTWDDLTPMHDGLLTASPWETNLLSAGGYTFAIKAIDDSGIESESALFVIAELSDPRLAGMIYNVLPHTQGWPGTKNNCHIEGIGLYANSQKTWADLTTWNDFNVWAIDPHTDIYYEHSVIDLGGVLPFVPFVEVIADGTVIIEESHSSDGTTYSSFAAIGGLINARYIKIRVSINHTYPSIQSLNIKLSGKTISEEINDLNTSSLAGVYRIGVGDIRLPIANPYTQITQVNLTLQNVGPGFSYELIDKDTTVGPRIKIYNSSNALADATIDALIKGA